MAPPAKRRVGATLSVKPATGLSEVPGVAKEEARSETKPEVRAAAQAKAPAETPAAIVVPEEEPPAEPKGQAAVVVPDGAKAEDAKAKVEEAKAESRAKAEPEKKLRVMLAGDAEGSLVKLYAQVESQQKKGVALDLLLAVGSFLPGAEGGASAAQGLAEFATGKRKIPLDTHFVEGRSAALLQSAPEGKRLCEGLTFLGGYGIRDIHGLRVAFLSGHYDANIYQAQATEEAGPAFVGAAYTPRAVRALARLASEPGSPPVDILLTAEWPCHLEEKLGEADKPRHPEGIKIELSALGSPAIAELCTAVEPRYHVFGTQDMFYQRAPFQTLSRGHVCRCIALGKVGSKGKARAWIHALALAPALGMPEAILKQRPETTTPCPFPIIKQEEGGDSRLSRKREAGEMEPDNDEGHVIPDQVFLARLPQNIDEDTLRRNLKRCGKIENIRLARDEHVDGRPCKGFGWVTFSSPEEADAACELNGMLEAGGRKLSICLARQLQGARTGKKREVQIVIEPHADCWFCLVNPKVEKHMIVTASPMAYVAGARGPVNDAHVLVMPVKHAPCYAACPSDLQKVLDMHVAAIRKMCIVENEEVLVWERWIPMGVSAANHMQIQLVPIEKKHAGAAREELERLVQQHFGGGLKRINNHKEVVQHLNDDSTTPYIYFECPGDATAKGRVVERYVFAGVSPNARIPMNFGREWACNLLDLKERLDWRQCQDDRETEKRLAMRFRETFLPFDPAKKPK